MRLRGTLTKLLDTLRRIEEPHAVCYEASCGYGYLRDSLGSIARRVVVPRPVDLRLIFRTKKKDDRVNAKKWRRHCLLFRCPSSMSRARTYVVVAVLYHPLKRQAASWLGSRAWSVLLIVPGLAGTVIGVMPVLAVVMIVAGVVARLRFRRRERTAALA